MFVRTASFVGGDFEVRVRYLSDENGRHFSIAAENMDDPIIVQNIPLTGQQIGETFQFLSDCACEEDPNRMSPFVRAWVGTASQVYENAKQKGFWNEGENRNNGEMIALIHSELSEALEGLRKGNGPDDKLPQFTAVEIELADAVIRIMDMAYARNWKVAQAIEAKMAYNRQRGYKHGKEF